MGFNFSFAYRLKLAQTLTQHHTPTPSTISHSHGFGVYYLAFSRVRSPRPIFFSPPHFPIHNYQFTALLFLICLPRQVLEALDPVPSHFPHLLVYFICLFYHHHNLYLRKQDSVYYLHAFPRSLWVKTRGEITVSCIEIWIKSWGQLELKTNGLMH